MWDVRREFHNKRRSHSTIHATGKARATASSRKKFWNRSSNYVVDAIYVPRLYLLRKNPLDPDASSSTHG